jgi:hypothetical protein
MSRDTVIEDLQFIIKAIGPPPRPAPVEYLGQTALRFAEEADVHKLLWAAECLTVLRRHVVAYTAAWRGGD